MRTASTRTLTLTLFVLLVGGFVAYRGGFFNGGEGFLQLSPNGSQINQASRPGAERDTSRKVMMSSSKSMIMTDEPVVPDSTVRELPEFMGSSKSGRIFVPETDTLQPREQEK